jgi:fructose transport system ATP-binding protein
VNGDAPILEARALVKRYGHVVALNGADLELFPNEILAIIGDNGAGKSTLIKALSGALQPDEGEIRLAGERAHFRSPRDARGAGIETVDQDLAVAPALDIAANIFLGREARRRGPAVRVLRMLDKRGMRVRLCGTSQSSGSGSRRSLSPSRISREASGKALP